MCHIATQNLCRGADVARYPMSFLATGGLSSRLDREGGLGTFPRLLLTSAKGRPPRGFEAERALEPERGRESAFLDPAVEEVAVEPILGFHFWPGSLEKDDPKLFCLDLRSSSRLR